MVKNKTYKKQLFMHMDGITILPTVSALNQIGILDYINKKKSFYIDDIIRDHQLNEGYLNIAMRNLLSIGILRIDNNETYADKKRYYINSNE